MVSQSNPSLGKKAHNNPQTEKLHGISSKTIVYTQVVVSCFVHLFFSKRRYHFPYMVFFLKEAINID